MRTRVLLPHLYLHQNRLHSSRCPHLRLPLLHLLPRNPERLLLRFHDQALRDLILRIRSPCRRTLSHPLHDHMLRTISLCLLSHSMVPVSVLACLSLGES